MRLLLLSALLLFSTLVIAHEGVPVTAKDDDPIPCTGGGCPPIEVEEDPTPIPAPHTEPTPQPWDAPYEAPPQPEDETDGELPSQLDCNLALSTYSQDMQRISMTDWSYFGTIEIPYPGYQSEYADNYITAGSVSISPSCADAVVTLAVVRHWFMPLVTDPDYCTLLFVTVVIDDSGEVTNSSYPIPQVIAEQGICK